MHFLTMSSEASLVFRLEWRCVKDAWAVGWFGPELKQEQPRGVVIATKATVAFRTLEDRIGVVRDKELKPEDDFDKTRTK